MTSIFKKLSAGTLALFLMFAVSTNISVAQGQQGPAQGETVVDKLNSKEKTSDFSDIVEKSGFGQVLAQKGSFTVLAPTNEALEKEGVDVDAAKENRKQAQKVVQNHLYNGEISSKKVESSMGVKVQDKDESASNGVVYVVDKIVTR